MRRLTNPQKALVLAIEPGHKRRNTRRLADPRTILSLIERGLVVLDGPEWLRLTDQGVAEHHKIRAADVAAVQGGQVRL